MDTQEIVNAILDPELDESTVCSIQPLHVQHNVVFVVNLAKLGNVKDLYCDDMGSWRCNGVYRSWLKVNDIGFVTCYGKSKPVAGSDTYNMTRKYFLHKTSKDLKKTVAFLSGKCFKHWPPLLNQKHDLIPHAVLYAVR